jgi:short-subunit dehydrogenase
MHSVGSHGFRQRDVGPLNCVQVMATIFKGLGPTAEHLVKFVHQLCGSLVALLGLDGGVKVGTIDFDVSLGGEAMLHVLARVALELNAHADDAFLVAKKPGCLFLHERLQRRGELEVDAGYDHFVCRVVFVHGFGFRFGCGRQKPPVKNHYHRAMPSVPETLRSFVAVIVTGGSSGLGKAFIEHVVKGSPTTRFCNLSRSKPGINLPEHSLRHIPCDLEKPAEVARGAAEALAWLREVAPTGRVLLINNSGFGSYGRFPAPSLDHQLAMVDLNVRAVVHLTGLLLPELRVRGGAILNVASTAAFQPTTFMATYGATKAFLLHWSLSLNEELRGTGLRALAVCPGPTATNFGQRAGMKLGSVPDSLSMSGDAVVMQSFRALAAGRAQVVTGWKNKLLTALSSKVPKPLAARGSTVVLKKYRLKQANPS